MKYTITSLLCLILGVSIITFSSCEEIAESQTDYEPFTIDNNKTYYFSFGFDLDLLTQYGTVLNSSCYSYPAGLYGFATGTAIVGYITIKNGLIILEGTTSEEDFISHIKLYEDGSENEEEDAKKILFGDGNSTAASNYIFSINDNNTVKMTSKSSAVCDLVLTGRLSL